jgi:hypothetical protein
MAKQFSEKPTLKPVDEEEGHEGHGGSHWWFMVLCCLPMVGIALLIILGIWNIR